MINVLDKGFVRLVDSMGDDAAIVQAARVSYGAGTKSSREDAALIDHLMRLRHTSPFEQVVLKFHIKMPLFVAQQFIRHRTASLNQESARYSIVKNEFYVPTPDRVQSQDNVNKQGSAESLPNDSAALFAGRVDGISQVIHNHYKSAINNGVARELARVTLPVNTYTQMYWQMDLHNLLHFLKLRLDSHAQWEIQQYAQALSTYAKQVAPVAYDAWERHVLNAVTLSSDELDILKGTLDTYMVRHRIETSDLRKSRQRELLQKLGLNQSEK